MAATGLMGEGGRLIPGFMISRRGSGANDGMGFSEVPRSSPRRGQSLSAVGLGGHCGSSGARGTSLVWIGDAGGTAGASCALEPPAGSSSPRGSPTGGTPEAPGPAGGPNSGGEATGAVGFGSAVGVGLARRPSAARGPWVVQGSGRLAARAGGGVCALTPAWLQRLVGDLLRGGRCSTEGPVPLR